VTLGGQDGKVKSVNTSPTAGPSKRALWGIGAGCITADGCNVITIGTWYEPVEGRGMSQKDTKGERAEFGTMSNTDGLMIVSKGKGV